MPCVFTTSLGSQPSELWYLSPKPVIIGYSLPQHDDYARQALFWLVKNYQESWWDQEFPGGRRKRRLLLIDYRPEVEQAENYRRCYAFVDPEKAVYHLQGFDEEAIRLIRGES